MEEALTRSALPYDFTFGKNIFKGRLLCFKCGSLGCQKKKQAEFRKTETFLGVQTFKQHLATFSNI